MTAIRKLQEAYDALGPDDSPTWAESSEWVNIHYVAVDDLIKRGYVSFAGVKLVEADVLCIKVQDAAEKAVKLDHECNLGQLLVALKACDYEEAKRLADLFLGKDKVRDLAGDLVNAVQDEIYRLYMQEAA
jgi:hypothetical protein